MTAAGRMLEAWEIESINARASVLMEEGIRLMKRDNVEAALISFDRARALRSRLPTHVPGHAYDLAACWLNRAEALARLDRIHHPLALQAYDEALALLRSLPLGEDVRFPKRLAVAHQNRALALAALDPAATNDAIAAFREAIAVLEQAEAMDKAERAYLLAVMWMNLAHVQIDGDTGTSDLAAQAAAQRSLTLASPYERQYHAAAEIGLRTRHILCVIAGRRLSKPVQREQARGEAIDFSDLIESGLDLVREWEQRGIDSFRYLAADLFRFGARLYSHYQPQFLREFLNEYCAHS